MASNVENARAQATFPAYPWNTLYASRKRDIPCFRKCKFFAYGKQSNEIWPRLSSSAIMEGFNAAFQIQSFNVISLTEFK